MKNKPHRNIVQASNIIVMQDIDGFPYDPKSAALFHHHFNGMLTPAYGPGYKMAFHVAYNVVRAADYIDDRLCKRSEEPDLAEHIIFTLERIRPDSYLRMFEQHPWNARHFEDLEYGVLDLLGGDIITQGSFEQYNTLAQVYSCVLERFHALRQLKTERKAV